MTTATAVQLASSGLDALAVSRRIEDMLKESGLTVERGRGRWDVAELYVYFSARNPYLGVSVFVESDPKRPESLSVSLSDRAYVKFPLTDVISGAHVRVLDSEKLLDLGIEVKALHEFAKTHDHFLSDINGQTVFFLSSDILFFTNTLFSMLDATPSLLSS